MLAMLPPGRVSFRAPLHRVRVDRNLDGPPGEAVAYPCNQLDARLSQERSHLSSSIPTESASPRCEINQTAPDAPLLPASRQDSPLPR